MTLSINACMVHPDIVSITHAGVAAACGYGSATELSSKTSLRPSLITKLQSSVSNWSPAQLAVHPLTRPPATVTTNQNLTRAIGTSKWGKNKAKTYEPHPLPPHAAKVHDALPLRPLNPISDINIPTQLIHRALDPRHPAPERDVLAQQFARGGVHAQRVKRRRDHARGGLLVVEDAGGR